MSAARPLPQHEQGWRREAELQVRCFRYESLLMERAETIRGLLIMPMDEFERMRLTDELKRLERALKP